MPGTTQTPIEWGSVAQWVGAFATLCAVIIALLKEEIVRMWRRPKLTVTYRHEPPDSHKTRWNYPVQIGLQVHYKQTECYFFRLWVSNQGKMRAEKVQVFADKLYKKTANGTFEQMKEFLPMNLVWSYTHEIFAEGISPLMGKHCDLGHITFPDVLGNFNEDLSDVQSEKTIFALDLEQKPNTKTHLLSPGIYKLDLRIAGANVSPVLTRLEITMTGDWHDDQEKMFRDGVGIKII